jgi:hypothetical protein
MRQAGELLQQSGATTALDKEVLDVLMTTFLDPRKGRTARRVGCANVVAWMCS